MSILITRPIDQVSPLLEKLKSIGVKAVSDPLLSIHPRLQALPSIISALSSAQAIITTSFQAISILAKATDQRDFPLWCVGEDSGQKARQLGFSQVYASQGTAEKLESDLKGHLKPSSGKIFHLSGDSIRVDIAKQLRLAGFDAIRKIVYEARAATTFQQTTVHSLQNNLLTAVLFYSPRTASVFAELCHTHKLEQNCQDLIAICFSHQIAQSAKALPWKKIIASPQTTTENFLKAVKQCLSINTLG